MVVAHVKTVILSLGIITICVFNIVNSIRWEMQDEFYLPKRQGVQVGYERKVTLMEGQEHIIRTLSLKPTIFEIDDFLTAEECNYLIYLAQHTQLIPSLLEHDRRALPFEITRTLFEEWDKNSNGFLEPMEFTFIDGKGDIYLMKRDVLQMFDELDMDKNGDGLIDYDELAATPVSDMRRFWDRLKIDNPGVRSRNSNQTFLWPLGAQEQLLEQLHERISRLTMLPHDLIETSEPLQIVLYNGSGHYHCHHDSNDLDDHRPCCTYRVQESCRACRYLTIIYYLNDVEGGGETAFPVANNKTFSKAAWEREHNEICNLVTNCSSSNLLVKPKKGKAIMWYNHEVETETGWLGEMDHMTYHGGCAVTEGEKWIASVWINLIGKRGSVEAGEGWLQDAIPRTRDEL